MTLGGFFFPFFFLTRHYRAIVRVFGSAGKRTRLCSGESIDTERGLDGSRAAFPVNARPSRRRTEIIELRKGERAGGRTRQL